MAICGTIFAFIAGFIENNIYIIHITNSLFAWNRDSLLIFTDLSSYI